MKEMAKLVKKKNSKMIAENQVSIFHEYDLPFQDFSVGISEIQGRYPKSGYDVDEEVDAVWYVERGQGRVFAGAEVFELEAGDMIQIEHGEKFWINGDLKLVVVSSPPWYPRQHKHIET